MNTDPSFHMSWLANSIAGGTILATIIGWFPAIAAVVAFIWYIIQIYESATFQKFLGHVRAWRVKRLQAKLKRLEDR